MDKAREHVGETLRSLKDLGIERLIMLTGDNQRVGEVIGREVGIDSVMADLLPEGKVAAIVELQRRHGRVAMIGDGVNDAPALAHATVGIAMGGAGTAVALETADVALMGDDLSRLPFAVSLSRQARRIIRQNLVLAISVIILLIFAGSMGLASIGPAVVMHEGSTIVVIINALRLLAFTGDAKA
jgi:Cd2+/Zn2+-exporting ATPase